MTGFGKSRWEGDQATISCEIKALNGRYFEADIRLPRYLAEMDALIRKKLGEVLERGTVSVSYSIRWEDTRPPEERVQVNLEVAQSHYAAMKKISDSLSVPMNDPLRDIIRVPDVINNGDKEVPEELKSKVLEVTLEAANQLNEFRITEGSATGEKLKELVKSISDDLTIIEHEEDNRREALRERVYGNVLEHVKESNIDENRLEQEILLYLDKWDIAEEKQRLGQHIKYFNETLDKEPTGRKLNFISQEMGREMNTLGVKSNYFLMQERVVQMKEKLEQIKEQVLNIV